MKAYELIDSPEKWLQHFLWKDANGIEIWDGKNDTAVSFCAVGAICTAYRGTTAGQDAKMLNKLQAYIPKKYKRSIAKWNNAPERTWNEVYTALKELDI